MNEQFGYAPMRQSSPAGGGLQDMLADPLFLMGLGMMGTNDIGRGGLLGIQQAGIMQDRATEAEYRKAQIEAARQKALQEQAQQMQMAQLIGQLPPEQRAAAMADPSLAREMLKNSMGMTRRYEMTERGPFDTYTGQMMGAPGQQPQTLFDNPYYKQMATEFDLSKYHPNSVKAAVAAGDPGLLKERLGFSDVMGQRERFDKRLAPLRQASQASAQIGSLVNQRGAFSDVATVYSLVKMLDPESVVREGEVSLMQTAMPLYDKLQTYVGRVKEGGLIGDVLRRDIVETMNRLNKLYARNAEKLRTEITGIATQYGVDPGMWMGSPIEFPELQGAPPPPPGFTERVR